MISVQNGRQYLMAHTPKYNRITSYRLDNIVSVKIDGACDRFDELRQTLDNMQRNMWGVSTQGVSGQRLEHVDFTVHYDDNEQYEQAFSQEADVYREMTAEGKFIDFQNDSVDGVE